MRKVLAITLGLGILAGVQSASADQIRQACVNIALQQCNALGGQCTTSAQYLSLYNQCVTTETVKAAAVAKQKQQNAAVTAAARAGVQPRTYHSK